MRPVAIALAFASLLAADSLRVGGLREQAKALRDPWGVPHIYDVTVHDLFFAEAKRPPWTGSFRSICGGEREQASSRKFLARRPWRATNWRDP
jgi:hypothetical protein